MLCRVEWLIITDVSKVL